MTKITDNTAELSFHDLTSKSSILLIPLFQRSYVWSQKQLDRMIREIEEITSGKDSTRFLGSVIAVSRTTNPSEPTPNEIVDGQQRLTTLYLFLLGGALVSARAGMDDYARGLVSANLIVDWAQQIPVNTKLQPSISDRAQFNQIFKRVSAAGALADWLPTRMKLPQASGAENGALFRQFERIRIHLQKRFDLGGSEELDAILNAVRHALTFVFILLKDPGSATTVFEGLNDPGVPISVGDLVKNEVFAKVGYNETEARLLHENRWKPFREKFNESFSDYFFPFCVVHAPNTSQTDMFGELRSRWRGLSAEQIVDDLDEYSVPYLTLAGINDPEAEYGAEVGVRVARLVALKSPSSIYPFVMRLLYAFTAKKVSRQDVVNCLDSLESFLVRRALCGIEPTGLLGLFRTMWANLDGHPTAERFQEVVLRRLTVEWPSDARVRDAIRFRPLYTSATIAKFVVTEFDRSLGMDHPPGGMSIEHVMPQSQCEAWEGVVTPAQHNKLKHLWANLVPCSTAMNTTVAQSAYASKRALFARSMFASTRGFAADFAVWDEAQIMLRSDKLADWAVVRWRRPEEAV